MKLLHLAAARPNFMKVAPLYLELSKTSGIEQLLVHSGQHYDPNLSDIFFKQLNLPTPHIHLNISSKNREEQINLVREKLKSTILDYKPDYTVVVGDVNSTLGGALAAKDSNCTLIHVEAGLRSFDLTMPEEINRIETDKLSDMLFVTENSGIKNLENEKIKGQIFFVGNLMIDSLVSSLTEIKKVSHKKALNLNDDFFVGTFHRPANVDSRDDLNETLECIHNAQNLIKLVLPLHPRTKASLEKHGLTDKLLAMKNLIITEPLGYFEFMSLILDSKGIITDSGGIQEESTYLRIPCLTIRDSTERPVTVEIGSNQLIPRNAKICEAKVEEILSGKIKESGIPPLWDGKAASRIKEVICKDFAV